MTDQLPGRTPPWGLGVWTFPAQPPLPQPQAHPVRIGDAERDEALNKLGDHFAAGRLTREELDERSEAALGARLDSDLEPLFRDLPAGPRAEVGRPARRPRSAGLSTTLLVLVPLVLVVAVIASIAFHGPIFFGPVIWLLVLSRMGQQHRHR